MKKFLTEKSAKVFEKYKYIFVVIIVGMLLLVLPQNKSEKIKSSEISEEIVVEKFEERIESALSRCYGVGRCEVILSIESGSEKVYEKEARKSARENEGGVVLEQDSDIKPSILSEGSGRESALVVKEVYPKFRGAVVICDGAEKAEVERAITESITALTGLRSDKISIIKMEK